MTEDLAWGVYNFINEWKAGNHGEISLQDALDNDFCEEEYVEQKKPLKFYIRRTSQYWDTTPPCDRAVRLNPNKEEWEDTAWGIEISTLEELIELKNKVKSPIIVGRSNGDTCDYSEYELEIYDDYRE